MAKEPTNTKTLRAGGPTLEEWTERGYKAAQYPPAGYAEVDSPALRAFKEQGTEPEPGSITHVALRSRGARFRRAGLSLTSEWQTFRLTDLTDDQLARLKAEPAIEVRELKAGETAGFNAGALPGEDDDVSKAQLRQALSESNARAERLDAELTALKAKISGVDMPPKAGELPAGQTIASGTVATLGMSGPPVGGQPPPFVPPAK